MSWPSVAPRNNLKKQGHDVSGGGPERKRSEVRNRGSEHDGRGKYYRKQLADKLIEGFMV